MRPTTAILTALVLLAVAADAHHAAAQRADWPTDCTQSTSSATVFIGHDCGEWASIMIVGRIEIRKPWSRTTRASRAVRIRERREGRGAAVSTEPASDRDRRTAGDGSVVLYGIDVSGGTDPADLDCGDFASPEDARALWDQQGWSATNDPHNLDGRGTTVDDGDPCE